MQTVKLASDTFSHGKGRNGGKSTYYDYMIY